MAGRTAHGTDTMPDSSTQNTVSHEGCSRDGTSMAVGKCGWDEGPISPRRQEECTTKAVDTGTEKGH